MNPLVAIDPIEPKGQTFENFCEAVKLFQEKGLLSKTTIASAIHSALYPVPISWYSEMKRRYAIEALDRIEAACECRFAFQAAKVLQSNSSWNEDLVAQLTRYGIKTGRNLIVVGSNNRKGLPHWILGSFAETAALTAKLPVLVVKPHWNQSSYSRKVRILLAIDANVPPTIDQIRWISKMAKASSAEVDLAYVLPKRRMVIDAVQPSKGKNEALETLKKIQKSLSTDGTKAQVQILDETKSLAHTLAEFADERKTWLTIATSTKRSLSYKLLLGSTARRFLTLTERPFLSLRLE